MNRDWFLYGDFTRRAQKKRDQIRKHLAWLDTKIAELGEKPDEPSDEPAAEDEQAGTEAPLEPSAEEPEEEASIDARRYQVESTDEVLRAKVGCFLLFVLGIVLVFFLIFGLPHYII